MAITNCLNFGNPYKPEMYWVFKEAVGGMGDACSKLNTPVTGGNVSFYNENPESAVFPTPTIGMLGLIDDVDTQLMTAGFKEEGDVIFYIGAERKGLGGSEYLSSIYNLTEGDAPEFNLDFEAKLQEVLLEAIHGGKLNAAHDVSDGGLLVCLVEMAIFSGLGANVNLSVLGSDVIEVSFSEAQSGVVITVSKDKAEQTAKFFESRGIPVHKIGSVKGEVFEWAGNVKLSVKQLTDIYENAIPGEME